MKGRIATLAIALLAAVPTPLVSAQVPASSTSYFAENPRDVALRQSLQAIAARPGMRIGIAVVDLDRGGSAMVNADQMFPMASTAKIAISATYLSLVETGARQLDQRWPMMVPVAEPAAMRSAVAKVRQGLVYPAEHLMELSITRSNNEATDGLLAAVGGPASVNAWLAKNGITGQHLDHTMATLVRDDGAVNPVSDFSPRTASTPRAMVSLLAAIDRGSALTPTSRAVLLDIMTRTITGSTRIRAGLPQGTIFAHKTGTLNGVTNDVGIIRMPDGRHVALAVFVAGRQPHRAHGQVIASVARTVYEAYTGTRVDPNAFDNNGLEEEGATTLASAPVSASAGLNNR